MECLQANNNCTNGTGDEGLTCSRTCCWEKLGHFYLWLGCSRKDQLNALLQCKTVFPGICVPIIKIRWLWDHRIFIMGIPFLVETVSLHQSNPASLVVFYFQIYIVFWKQWKYISSPLKTYGIYIVAYLTLSLNIISFLWTNKVSLL